MTDRATKVVFRGIMAVISVVALLGPSLSQALCSPGCTGGQCEPLVTEVLCDLDVAGSCCDQSDGCDQERSVNPAFPQIAGNCEPCACFDHEPIAVVPLPKNQATAKASHTIPASPGAPSLQGMQLAGLLPARPSAPRTHAPPVPIYRLTHTLLI
jgi:hypothetical protein